MSAEFTAEFVHRERARLYAWGRFDAESFQYVPSQDFADAVMDSAATVAQFPALYNRMANERTEMLTLARIESTREAA